MIAMLRRMRAKASSELLPKMRVIKEKIVDDFITLMCIEGELNDKSFLDELYKEEHDA